jgi:hypothetical protein
MNRTIKFVKTFRKTACLNSALFLLHYEMFFLHSIYFLYLFSPPYLCCSCLMSISYCALIKKVVRKLNIRKNKINLNTMWILYKSESITSLLSELGKSTVCDTVLNCHTRIEIHLLTILPSTELRVTYFSQAPN